MFFCLAFSCCFASEFRVCTQCSAPSFYTTITDDDVVTNSLPNELLFGELLATALTIDPPDTAVYDVCLLYFPFVDSLCFGSVGVIVAPTMGALCLCMHAPSP